MIMSEIERLKSRIDGKLFTALFTNTDPVPPELLAKILNYTLDMIQFRYRFNRQ